ncbi:MAG: pyridoxal-phosphate dependent enzyme [Candidatus Dojkabacteria bacterium]|nr:MAG: pyridoxal-phosphate dependent enzyme [Candidatus Dojkabacteria bacterium]
MWDYRQLHSILPQNRLTLGEGNTALEQISLNGNDLYLKFEDANPNGSFKDRSLAYQLSYYVQNENKHFTISSSGNAAISAAAYANLAKVKLCIFVSTNISELKLTRLEQHKSEFVEIRKVPKPKSSAIQYARESNAINLRGSVDDVALIGFKTIAYEIAEQLPDADAVFVPCSSATSSVAIAQGFGETNRKVALHVVQTTRICPIVSNFDQVTLTKTSLADAIVDRVAKRKKQVLIEIEKSNGFGWIITDQELLTAEKLIEDTLPNKKISYNSLLAVAAYLKAIKSGYSYVKPVAIISGL